MDEQLGALLIRLLFDDKQFLSQSRNAQGQFQRRGTAFTETANAINKAVSAAFVAAGAAITTFVASSAQIGAGFQRQVDLVGSIAQASTAELAALESRARELGASTEFSATEAAQGLQALAQAGASVEESIRISGDALNFAIAQNTGLQGATEAVVSTLRQFQLTADESGRVTDVLTAATQSSLLNFQDLTEALTFAGPAAGSLGVSLEETIAGIAAFRDIGLEGSIAGTAFRQALVEAARGTDRQVEALEAVGLTLEEINPAAVGFNGIIERLAASTAETADIIQVFGVRAGPALASAVDRVRAGVLDLNVRTEQLGDTAGRTQETVDRLTDNVVGAFREVVSAAEDVRIAAFGSFQEPLQTALEAVQPVLNQISEAIEGVSDEIETTLTVAVNNFAEALEDNGSGAADAFAQTLVVAANAAAALINILTDLINLLGFLKAGIDALPLGGLGDEILVLVGVFSSLTAAATALRAALTLLGVSSKAFGAALTAIGGPITVTIATVAALTFALFQYRSAVIDAQRETEALEGALADLERRAQGLTDRLTDTTALEDLREGTAAFVAEQQAAIAAGEELTTALEEEADALSRLANLTDEEIEIKVQAGDLVVVGDQLRTVAGIVDSLDEEGLTAIEDRARAFREEAAQIERNLVGVRDRLTESRERAEEFGDSLAQFEFGTEAATERFIEEQERRIEETQRAEANLLRERDAAEAQRLARARRNEEEQTRIAKAEAAKRAQEGKKEADERIREAERAAEAIAQILEQAQDAEAGLFLTDVEQLQQELDQSENAVLDALETFLANFAGTEEERRRVVQESQTAILALRRNNAEQLRQLEEESLAQAADAVARRQQVVVEATAAQLSQVEQLRQQSATTQSAIEESLSAQLEQLAQATEARAAQAASQTERLRIVEEGVQQELEAEQQAAEQRARVIEVTEARIQLALARTPAEILRARDALREVEEQALSTAFGVEDVGEFLASLEGRAGPLERAFDKATANIQQNLVQRLGPEAFSAIADGITAVGNAISFLAGGATFGIQTLQQLIGEAQAAQQAAEDAVTAAQEQLDEVQGAEEEQAAEELQAAQRAAFEAQRALQGALQEGDRGAIQEAQRALAEAERGVEAATEGLTAAREGTSEAITEAADELNAAQEELRRVGEEAGADVANAFVEGVLGFVETVSTSIDDILVTLIDRVDEIVIAVIKGLFGPDGIISRLDEIVIALVELLILDSRKIVGALIKALLLDLPTALVTAARDALEAFFVDFVPRLIQSAIDFANRIVDILTFGLSGLIRSLGDPDSSGGGEEQGIFRGGGVLDDLERIVTAPFRAIGNLFGGASNPQGVPFVQRTMGTIVHEGERILSAAENRPFLEVPGALERAVPPVGAAAVAGGGFPSVIEIVNQIGDRTLDRTLVEADQRGGLGVSNRRSRQKNGTRVGFTRPSERTK